MAKFTHLFFDLDGTLTDSQEGITNSLQYALSKYGRNAESSALREALGPPLTFSFTNLFGLNKQDVNQAIVYYRERFEATGMLTENKLYPGVYDLLTALSKHGYHMSIVTSKPGPYAEKIAAHFGIGAFFDGIYGATFTRERTEKIDMLQEAVTQSKVRKDKVVMIGDRMYDLEAAEQAGVASIGVLYGYGAREELEKYRALFLAEDVSALYNYFIE